VIKEKKDNFVALLVIAVVIALAFLYFQIGSTSSNEVQNNQELSGVDKSVLPKIMDDKNLVYIQALGLGTLDGTIEFANKNIEVVNGYPSAESIASLLQLPPDAFSLEKDGNSVLIKNGNCLIAYTEATESSPPIIADLFNNCK